MQGPSGLKHWLAPWGLTVGLGVFMPSPGAEALDRVEWKPPARGVELDRVDGPTALSRGYRLAVVDVPDVPDLPPPIEPIQRPQPTLPSTCPLEVRAIAGADGDRFAVVSLPGAGDDSSLLRRGDKMRTAQGRLEVVEVERRYVRARLAQTEILCKLAAPARAERDETKDAGRSAIKR